MKTKIKTEQCTENNKSQHGIAFVASVVVVAAEWYIYVEVQYRNINTISYIREKNEIEKLKQTKIRKIKRTRTLAYLQYFEAINKFHYHVYGEIFVPNDSYEWHSECCEFVRLDRIPYECYTNRSECRNRPANGTNGCDISYKSLHSRIVVRHATVFCGVGGSPRFSFSFLCHFWNNFSLHFSFIA